MYNHIMVDLETLGNGGNASIIAIGAVAFDPLDFNDTEVDMRRHQGDLKGFRTFYKIIDADSCIRAGFDVDASTIYWWLQQSEAARRELYGGLKHPIADVLKNFYLYFQYWTGKDGFMWGNGANFDNPILANAYRRVLNCDGPVKYSNNLCFRTMKRLGLVDKKEFDFKIGTAHNALDDAIYQALCLQKIYKRVQFMREKVDEFPFGVAAE